MFEEILECEDINEMKEIITDVINDEDIELDFEDLRECLKEMYDGERMTKDEVNELMEFAADLADNI